MILKELWIRIYKITSPSHCLCAHICTLTLLRALSPTLMGGGVLAMVAMRLYRPNPTCSHITSRNEPRGGCRKEVGQEYKEGIEGRRKSMAIGP